LQLSVPWSQGCLTQASTGRSWFNISAEQSTILCLCCLLPDLLFDSVSLFDSLFVFVLIAQFSAFVRHLIMWRAVPCPMSTPHRGEKGQGRTHLSHFPISTPGLAETMCPVYKYKLIGEVYCPLLKEEKNGTIS
jgi:hypothetical protein